MSRSETKITKAEMLQKIDPAMLPAIEQTAYCTENGCSGKATIVEYDDSIFVNDLGDTILRGKCEACGSPVNRYIETGEI